MRSLEQVIEADVREAGLPPDTTRDVIRGLKNAVTRHFERAVSLCAEKIRQRDADYQQKVEAESRSVSDFLYWKPPKGGFPDSNIFIGVEFEACCHEDWGFVVKQKVGDRMVTVGAGRNLGECLTRARQRIREDLENCDHRCSCGNEGISVNAETGEWLCMECFSKI